MSDIIAQLQDVRRLVQLKHQAGRHSQADHTPKKYGPAASASGDPQADLAEYIQYRKDLGTNVELDPDDMKYFNMALDEIKPRETVDSVDDVPYKDTHGTQDRGYLITGTDELVSITDEFGGGTNDHVGFATLSDDPGKFGMSDQLANDFLAAYMSIEYNEAMMEGWNTAFESGTVRVREFGGSTNIETNEMDNRTLRRLQRNYDNDKLHMDLGKKHYWEDNMEGMSMEFTTEDFLMAKSVGDLERRSMFKELLALLEVV
jgi:hypothetical protein